MTPDIDAIRAAARRLEGAARVTPLLEADLLNDLAGRRVLVKAECLQRTGSFKFRGAWSRLTALGPDERKRGVLGYSSGNHAQGVALAARLLGIPATIVMPQDAPMAKIEGTRAYGATVVTYDRAGGESREAIGAVLAERDGLTLVKPYDDPWVIAGQGTCGLEIAEQARAAGVERADVLVCTGGGGLISGIALALEADAPGLRARPCEPEGFDDVARSLVSGQRESNERPSGSICDAIVSHSPGELTFPIMHRLCGPGLVVSDGQAMAAVATAFARLKLVLEPGGAVALASALVHGAALEGDAVVVVATGGNVDPAMFADALAQTTAGRA
jgi:threonine dehydratase